MRAIVLVMEQTSTEPTSTHRSTVTADDMKKLYKVGQRRTVTVRGVTWTQVFTADGEWWNIDLAL